MEYRIDVAEIKAEMGRNSWTIQDLAEIWKVNRNTAAVYLKNPEKIPYTQMLLLSQAAGWDQQKAGKVFFAPEQTERQA